MTVLGNRVSADGIKLRSCGTGVGPESSDWCPYEKTETQTQRGERHRGQALGGCCDDGGGVHKPRNDKATARASERGVEVSGQYFGKKI